jgi:hypothetical protein
MRYERVKVKRDTQTTHNRPCPSWEIPILEYLFEDGNVERLGVFEEVAGEYPTPAKELDRLVRAYGSDPKSGVPHANSVYGNGRNGERSLAKLIDEAKAEDKAAAKPAKTTGKPRGRRAALESADSLLS